MGGSRGGASGNQHLRPLTRTLPQIPVGREVVVCVGSGVQGRGVETNVTDKLGTEGGDGNALRMTFVFRRMTFVL